MPKRVKEPTAVPDADGFPIVLSPDNIYADNHPLVKAHPGLFEDAFDESAVIAAPGRSKPAVEQATAAPGEKRG